jgi:hypothetical protein
MKNRYVLSMTIPMTREEVLSRVLYYETHEQRNWCNPFDWPSMAETNLDLAKFGRN